MGDNFTVDGTWRITEFVWYGGYENEVLPNDLFHAAVWTTDSAGNPASPLAGVTGAISRGVTGMKTPFDWNIYEYRWTMDPEVTLASGTYFLEVQNHTPTVPENWAWYTIPGPHFYYHREGEWFSSREGYSLMFSVRGESIPETNTAWMLLTLCGVAAARRARPK